MQTGLLVTLSYGGGGLLAAFFSPLDFSRKFSRIQFLLCQMTPSPPSTTATNPGDERYLMLPFKATEARRTDFLADLFKSLAHATPGGQRHLIP